MFLKRILRRSQIIVAGCFLLWILMVGSCMSIWGQTQVQRTKEDYLHYFREIKGKKCISGQFIRWNYNASLEEINETHRASGHWIGMLGADYYSNFQDSVPSPDCAYQLSNEVIDEYYDAGGLVNLSVHFNNPQTAGSAWDNRIDFDSVLIEGSRVQNNFLQQLDSVAAGLADLRSRNITVMFRPFHEMNGGWFWWGEQEHYKGLWQLTHDYLVRKKGLNILLWCWSPDAGKGNMHDFYPGDAYVDIVGLDSYGPDLPGKALANYQEILKYDKPFGFTEYGCVQGADTTAAANFDYAVMVDWLTQDFPEAVFFLVWRDHWGFSGKAGVEVLLNHPKIMGREE